MVRDVQHRHVPITLRVCADRRWRFDDTVLVPVPSRKRGGQPTVLANRELLAISGERIKGGGPLRAVVVPVPQPGVIHDGVERVAVVVQDPGCTRFVQRRGKVFGIK